MTEHGEYVEIGLACIHCGEKLSAKFDRCAAPIGPALPLEYVHTATRRSDCTVVRTARPYDCREASDAYKRATRLMTR